ncbi:MAG: hypothetical protein GY765_27100, partial [bacterium]|nr:hypothetical protein [bacterium]
WVLFIFLAGFFTGLFEQKNWLPMVTLSVPASLVLASIGAGALLTEAGFSPATLNGTAALAGAGLIILILGIAFALVFRKFDASSPALFARRFALMVLPFLLITAGTGIALM